jgi:hypothetical protein
MVVMNFLEMMKDRDDAIENELRGLIRDNVLDSEREQFEQRIHRAIEQGAKFWEETYLPAIVGDAALTAKILNRLKEPVN